MVVVARPQRLLWATARRRPPGRGRGEGLSLAAWLSARRGARRAPTASVVSFISRSFANNTSAERLLCLVHLDCRVSSVLRDASIILQRAGFAPESAGKKPRCAGSSSTATSRGCLSSQFPTLPSDSARGKVSECIGTAPSLGGPSPRHRPTEPITPLPRPLPRVIHTLITPERAGTSGGSPSRRAPFSSRSARAGTPRLRWWG